MDTKTYQQICKDVVPEGMVLLENDGSLPLAAGENIALFGRGQFEYVKSGSGSGGKVNCPYVAELFDELGAKVRLDSAVSEAYRAYIQKNPRDYGNGWNYPPSQKELVPDESFVKAAAKRNEKAVYVLTRTAGEGLDCLAQKGDWFLSEAEESVLELLSKYFAHTIVLVNAGNLIDMNWVQRYRIGTVMLVGQGGQEGAKAVAETLVGEVAPSGRLADTIATSLQAYPSFDCFGQEKENVHKEDIYVGYRYFSTFAPKQVLYPFGYGLGYTDFTIQANGVTKTQDALLIDVTVTNVGKYSGKEVVQLYVSAPQGKLGKPARELIAFAKTQTLQPQQQARLTLKAVIDDMASFDDEGKIQAFAYVLEAGEYRLYLGKNVRDAQTIGSFDVAQTRIVKQCTSVNAVQQEFCRLKNVNGAPVYEKVEAQAASKDCQQVEALPQTGNKGITFADVANGKHTVDEFLMQFSGEELTYLLKGEGMGSPKGSVVGSAGCFGGVAECWQKAGVPIATACDGPSGPRMENGAFVTCVPSGTLLACTWNPAALEGVFTGFSEELKAYGVGVILGPGMNIHRNPLGGRNFEYFSEDPYLTGCIAMEIARVFTKNGIVCTLKHYAANSQETNRNGEDEVMSERCLREIYLKGFEMAVKTGAVSAIMTSYNRINGVSCAANYGLVTTVLREEWGYKGIVMTDWWPNVYDQRKQAFGKKNMAAIMRAQNELYMVVPDSTLDEDDMKSALASGELTLGELQRNARNVLNFLLQTQQGFAGKDSADKQEKGACVYEANVTDNALAVELAKRGRYYVEMQYCLNADELSQHLLDVYVGADKRASLFVRGTGDKRSTCGGVVELEQNANLRFGGEANVESVRIYTLVAKADV